MAGRIVTEDVDKMALRLANLASENEGTFPLAVTGRMSALPHEWLLATSGEEIPRVEV